MIRYSSLLCGVAILWAIAVDAAEPPFVSGFDRFVAHKEISRETGGRLLLTELSCTACHQTERKDLQPKGGPDLNGVGTRAGFGWLRKYLSNPHQVKPGSTMPDLLSGMDASEKEQTIDALSAFLSTLTESYPEVKGSGAKPVPFQFWTKGNPAQGEKLYHTVGCVACHDPDPNYETAAYAPSPADQMLAQLDPEEIEELGLARLAQPVESVPHGDLSGKYTPEALTFFLLDPSKSRPAGRMPDFHLTPIEAADLAAYLISKHPEDKTTSASTPDPALVDKGRTLFVAIGCVNCHAVKGLKPQKSAKPLGKLNFESQKRCSSEDNGRLPDYELNDLQQASLQTAVVSLSQEHTLDFTLLQLNCYGCHERDERGGVGWSRKAYFETVGHVDLGDEGRIPPPLTGVGRKLTQSWMKKVLDGTGIVRPYLTARMPKFPAKTIGTLPADFSRVDELEQKTEPQVFGDTRELADAGRRLFDTGCVKCHPIRGEALPGVIGVDLQDATSRIHPEWFQTFLLDPGAVKPRTRMPTFFPKGVSSNKEILEGDVDKQIASLWAYLKDSDKLPLPEQVLAFRAQNFELVPKDKPIILRTFMEEAGTHAIAVGFPQGVHFAYDAEQVRLAQIWKGRFLDAQSTWFERFTPPSEPLGDHILTLSTGGSLRLTDEEGNDVSPVFRGFRLEKEGTPIFLSRLGPLDIEDRIEATDQMSLLRTMVVSVRKGEDFHQQLHWKPLIEADKALGPRSLHGDHGLKLGLLKGINVVGAGRLAKAITLVDQPTPSKPITVKIEYKW